MGGVIEHHLSELVDYYANKNTPSHTELKTLTLLVRELENEVYRLTKENEILMRGITLLTQ